MKKIITSIAILFSTYSFAQNSTVINDPNVEKRTLDASFTSISVTDGVSLYLTQGNEESIAISASDQKYMERYKTEVVNGELKIYYDNKGINWTGNEKRNLKAYVSFKKLEKLHASGGAYVMAKSIVKEDKAIYTFTSGSKFTGQVNIDELNIIENSGADIEMNGKAGKLNVQVSSGAVFNGYQLVTDYCEAKASSAGGVRITVNKELNVKANSGGGIHYKGKGVIKDMNVSSGGIVKKV